jgi:hypothetical protein
MEINIYQREHKNPKKEKKREELLIFGVAESVGYAASGRVVATDLDPDSITREYTNVILSDSTGNVTDKRILVVQANPKHAVGERLGD